MEVSDRQAKGKSYYVKYKIYIDVAVKVFNWKNNSGNWTAQYRRIAAELPMKSSFLYCESVKPQYFSRNLDFYLFLSSAFENKVLRRELLCKLLCF